MDEFRSKVRTAEGGFDEEVVLRRIRGLAKVWPQTPLDGAYPRNHHRLISSQPVTTIQAPLRPLNRIGHIHSPIFEREDYYDDPEDCVSRFLSRTAGRATEVTSTAGVI